MKVIVASNLNKNLPIGSLLFWGGLASELPTGWELFNSAADAFIMGTSAAGINLTKQGTDNHIHTIGSTGSGGNHTHSNISFTTEQNTTVQSAPTTESLQCVGFHTHSGTLTFQESGGHSHSNYDTDSAEHKPPYIRYYLMKCIDAIDVPIGAIAIWTGRLIDIPSGWHNCDGSTVGEITLPDIRGRFIYVPNNDNDKGTTGGAKTHTHYINGKTGPRSHQHSFSHGQLTYSGSYVWVQQYTPKTIERSKAVHTHAAKTYGTGLSASHYHTLPSLNSVVEILPPYIKAYYIMKVEVQ